MQAFALDANHDLSLDELGRLVLTDGAELVAQRIRTRLRWHRGEWAQNLTLGVDYRGQVLVKRPDLEVIRAMLLEAVAPVATVSSLEPELTSGRQLNVRLVTGAGVVVQETL